jgi:hypothetical protein
MAKEHRKHSFQRLGQLQKLAGTVDYRNEPHLSRDQIGKLLQAFEVLVMRMASAYSVRTPSEPYAESDERAIRRVHQWCIESLMAIGRSLSALQPIAIQRPPDGIFEDRQSAAGATGPLSDRHNGSADPGFGLASLTAYYRSLVEAILECQRTLESVDWKRWCWNRF